jgi:enamine deaminase RidA (YjgF/YER057c/UK114 family)
MTMRTDLAGGRRRMSGRIDERLRELGVELPVPAAPVANYVPYAVTGNLVFIAGQVSVWNGQPRFVGKLGAGIDIAGGKEAARLCALNILAQLRAACGGDLDRVRRIVRVGGFVNCTAEFTDMPQVVNGASDLMVEVFGDAGRHARAAVGVSSLPLGVAVEVEATAEIG